jgi:hypothetical protein
MLGGAAAGVAAYDYIRGKTFPTLTAEDIRSAGRDQVDSVKWAHKLLEMKPLKKPPIIITSVNEIDPMIQDLDLGRYRKQVVNIVKSVTEDAKDALAVDGEKHDYLILPAKVGRAVVEHEIGHLRAKEEKKDEPATFIDRMAALFWKPSYRKTTIGPEESAWGYVKDAPELQRKALGTYESAFHKQRSSVLGHLGAALLLGGILTPH